MNAQHKKMLSGLFALIVIALTLSYYFRKQRASISSNPETTTAKEAPSPFQANREIAFNETLLVFETTISIDGGNPQEVPFSKDGSQWTVFGYLQLDAGTRAEMVCVADYMGGISLTLKNSNGETITEKLGMKDGDAGDRWESRTWITKDQEKNKLHFRTIHLLSTEDIDTNKLIQCKIDQKLYSWDSNMQSFVTELYSPFDIKLFTPPIFVASRCLDDNGYWKGN